MFEQREGKLANPEMAVEDTTSGELEARSAGKVDPADTKARRKVFLARLVRMSAEERLRAARYGGFSRWERSLWMARFPDEVPLVNGEYEWIAMSLADLD